MAKAISKCTLETELIDIENKELSEN